MSRYHHGNLRQTLLDEAQKQLEQQGIDHLSLRALARSACVSQTAPYRHFPDKTALLVALAVEGFSELNALIREAAGKHSKPDDVLVELGMVYVEFACENPHRYKLMFGPTLAGNEEHPELKQAAEACFMQVQEMISRFEPFADEEQLWYLTANATALVRGHASMRIDGIMTCNPNNGEELDLRKALSFFMARLNDRKNA